MKKFCIVLIMSAVLVFPTTVFSQYLPVGLMPMEYNSSFAGSAGNPRVCTSTFFSHLINEYADYTRYGFHASYDQFVPKLRSGVGIKISGINTSYISGANDRALNFSALIAPKLSIKGKYTISPSLELGYNNDFWRSSNSSYKRNYNGFTGMAGILFNASNYYLGYMARVFQNESNRSDYWSSNLYSAFQFGYSFQKSKDSKFSFTPQLVFPLIAGKNSIEWYWPAYNLSFRFNHFIVGVINQYNIPYPVGFQLGWQKNGWRILLSNHFKGASYTNSNNKADYTVNFSLRYIFNQDKKSMHILNTY